MFHVFSARLFFLGLAYIQNGRHSVSACPNKKEAHKFIVPVKRKRFIAFVSLNRTWHWHFTILLSLSVFYFLSWIRTNDVKTCNAYLIAIRCQLNSVFRAIFGCRFLWRIENSAHNQRKKKKMKQNKEEDIRPQNGKRNKRWTFESWAKEKDRTRIVCSAHWK